VKTKRAIGWAIEALTEFGPGTVRDIDAWMFRQGLKTIPTPHQWQNILGKNKEFCVVREKCYETGSLTVWGLA
jgi:hypothetical protein